MPCFSSSSEGCRAALGGQTSLAVFRLALQCNISNMTPDFPSAFELIPDHSMLARCARGPGFVPLALALFQRTAFLALI